MAVQLASAYMQIIPSMQGFQGTIARQLSGEGDVAGRAVGGRFTSGFKGIVGAGAIAGVVGGLAGTAASAVGGALATGFHAAGSAIIGFNSTLQQSSIGFTTMLGSAQKSQAFVSQLQSFAAKTPFEFQGLVQNSNSLLGMGVAAKDVIPDLTALGDSTASVGGDANVLNNTISAFGQTMAKGTLDMGNMNQLLQGGVPNALKILASSYHVTTGEMVKMISSGKVQSSDALPRLIKGIEGGTKATAALGGMMDKQSVTFQGAMSNIGDASTQLLAKAFKPLFTEATAGANSLAKMLGSPQMTVWAGKIATGTTAAIGVFHRLKSAVSDFFAGLTLSDPKSIGAPLEGLVAVGQRVRVMFASLSGGGGLGSFFSQIGSALGPLIPALIQAVTAFSPIRIAVQALAPVLPVVTVALTQLSSALGAGLLSIVTALAPVIVGLVNGLVAFVVPLLQVAPLVQGVVLGLIAWRAVSVATAVATNAVAIATGVIGTVTKIAAAGQWLLNAAMSANPIGIVVVAIAALVAGLIWFFTQTDLGRQIWANFIGFLVQAWTNIVNVAQTVWGAIAGAVGTAINAVRTVVVTVVGGIVTAWNAYWARLGAVVNTVFGVISGIIGTVMNVVRNAVLIPLGLIILGWRAVWGLFGPVVRGALAAIVGFIRPIINGIRTVVLTVVAAIVTAWNRYWTLIFTAVRVVFTAIVGFVAPIINRIRSTILTVVGAIVTAWNRYWQIVSTGIRIVWNAIVSVVTTVINRVRSVITSVVGGIVSYWVGVWNRIFGVLRDAWNRIVSAVSAGVGKVVTFVQGIGGKVISAVSGFGKLLFDAGKNLIQGLINGATSLVGGLVKTVGDIAGKAISAAKAALGIHSPSTVFHGIGQNLVAGFVNGITRGHDDAHAAIQGLAGNVNLTSRVRLSAPPTIGGPAGAAGLGVAGFPSTVTLVDKNGSLLGHMDARIDRYDMRQQMAGSR